MIAIGSQPRALWPCPGVSQQLDKVRIGEYLAEALEDTSFTTETVLSGGSSTKDFSTEIDTTDHDTDGCHGDKFYAWAKTSTATDTGRHLGFWNARSC